MTAPEHATWAANYCQIWQNLAPESRQGCPCLAKHRGYICTLDKGHRGKHEASDGDIVVAVWR